MKIAEGTWVLIDKRSILKEARAKEAAALALHETEKRRQAAEQKERTASLENSLNSSEHVRGKNTMAAKKTSKAAKSAEAVVEAAKANIEEAAAAAAETAKEVRKVTEEKVKKVKKAVEPKVKEVKEAAEKKTRTVRAKKAAAPKATVTIEFAGRSVSAADIQEKAVKAYKDAHEGAEVKTIDLYVQPEEGVAYYVVNGEASPEFKIEL